jgi:hypothetical protein
LALKNILSLIYLISKFELFDLKFSPKQAVVDLVAWFLTSVRLNPNANLAAINASG